MNDHAELDAFISSLGLEYSATFVPQSQSRNAGEKNHSLNWRVKVRKVTDAARPAATYIETDYMQGIGHAPRPRIAGSKKSDYYRRSLIDGYEKNCAETGKAATHYSESLDMWQGAKAIPAPPLRDVLCSLVLDGDASEMTFEEWADTYGMDTDSRKAEAMYRTCDEHGKKLTRMLGTANLAKLRELFQDY